MNTAEISMQNSSSLRHLEMNPGTKKLYFIETTKLLKKRTAKPTASLNIKTGILYLGVAAVRTLGIANKFYKLYHDASNRVIGFKLEGTLREQKNGWKLAEPHKHQGMVPMSCKSAVNAMIGLKSVYKKLEIKRYKDYQSKIDDSTYYYVELK